MTRNASRRFRGLLLRLPVDRRVQFLVRHRGDLAILTREDCTEIFERTLVEATHIRRRRPKLTRNLTRSTRRAFALLAQALTKSRACSAALLSASVGLIMPVARTVGLIAFGFVAVEVVVALESELAIDAALWLTKLRDTVITTGAAAREHRVALAFFAMMATGIIITIRRWEQEQNLGYTALFFLLWELYGLAPNQ